MTIKELNYSNLMRLNMSTLKLLNAVIPASEDTAEYDPKEPKTLVDCIKEGFLFVDSHGTPIQEIDGTLFDITNMECYNRKIWSKHFYESWDRVASDTLENLLSDQLLHYFSTYGLEMNGLKSKPFVPLNDIWFEEKDFADPKVPGKMKLIYVVDESQMTRLIDEYFQVTLKPNKNSISSIEEIIPYATLPLDDIASFENKCMYCKVHNVVPKNNQLALRYIMYILTKQPMLIKSKQTIYQMRHPLRYGSRKQKKIGYPTAIKDADKVHDILTKVDPVEMSKIFYRYKPLFLALRADVRNRPVINKIGRLAEDNHQPLSQFSLQHLMEMISNEQYDKARKLISDASIRDLIKLLNYSSNSSDDKIYNIRNGKVYVQNRLTNPKSLTWLHDNCQTALIFKMKGKLVGQKFYIPEGIHYTAPVSEKQMLGNIPYGSYITADDKHDALCLSIAWNNIDGQRIDMDLHLTSATASYGFDGYTRSDDRTVLYSGDMTDAVNGATETMRFDVSHSEILMASVNLYHRGNKEVCPFKLFLSEGSAFKNMEDGMVDISTALTAPIQLKFQDTDEIAMGYLDGNRFVFYGGELGHNLVPDQKLYGQALEAIRSRCSAMYSLDALITLGGGQIVRNFDQDAVDLSSENATAKDFFAIVD